MQRAVELAIALLLWALPALAGAPTVDGVTGSGFNASVGFSASSSASISVTTSQSPDIIVLWILPEKQTGSPVTVSTVEGCNSSGSGCSGSLVWRRRSQTSFTSSHTCFGGNLCSQTQEVWWANSSATLSSHSISITFSGTVDFGTIQAVGVHGVQDTAHPWDTNGGLPKYKQRVSTDTAWVSDAFSTSQANDLLLAFWSTGQVSTSSDTICVGWSAAPQGGHTVDSQNVGYQGVTSIQTNITVAENGSSAGHPCDGSFARTDVPWMLTVDALTAGPLPISSGLLFQTPW